MIRFVGRQMTEESVQSEQLNQYAKELKRDHLTYRYYMQAVCLQSSGFSDDGFVTRQVRSRSVTFGTATTYAQ